MEGLKIRVMNNKIYIEMMKAMGASPTPMAFGELYSAMQQGTVDGQENPSAHIWTKRFLRSTEIRLPHRSLLRARTHADLHDDLEQTGATNKRKSSRKPPPNPLPGSVKSPPSRTRNSGTRSKATGQIEVIEVDRQPFMDATKSVHAKFADQVGQDNLDKIEALKKS